MESLSHLKADDEKFKYTSGEHARFHCSVVKNDARLPYTFQSKSKALMKSRGIKGYSSVRRPEAEEVWFGDVEKDWGRGQDRGWAAAAKR